MPERRILPMPQPRRRSRKKLIDFSGTKETIDILRDSYASMERIQSHIDAEAEKAARDAEIRTCQNDIVCLPIGDPKRTAAERQLRFISSWPYRLWRKLRLGCFRVARIFGHELFLAFLIPLQILLIAVFNSVAFMLVWWLLFGL